MPYLEDSHIFITRSVRPFVEPRNDIEFSLLQRFEKSVKHARMISCSEDMSLIFRISRTNTWQPDFTILFAQKLLLYAKLARTMTPLKIDKLLCDDVIVVMSGGRPFSSSVRSRLESLP